MKKEKLYLLKSENEVENFIENINQEFYYIDSDGNCYKGNALIDAIGHYGESAFIGEMKEIQPYYFYYAEIEKVSFKKRDIHYVGDSFRTEAYEKQDDAIAEMDNLWRCLSAAEKQNKIVFAYKAFGIPESLENDSDYVGFTAYYNGREYFSHCDAIPISEIFNVDRDISCLDESNLTKSDFSWHYQATIGNVKYKADIDSEEWELWKEIYIDGAIELFS